MDDRLTQIDERLKRIEAMLQSQKAILTVDEAVEYTGYSKAYLYRLTSSAEIPHYKRGRKLVFDRTELDEWMKSDKVSTAEDARREAETYCATHRIGHKK